MDGTLWLVERIYIRLQKHNKCVLTILVLSYSPSVGEYSVQQIDGLVQGYNVFTALAIEILQSCTKPWISNSAYLFRLR